jgi:hypothetical protein
MSSSDRRVFLARSLSSGAVIALNATTVGPALAQIPKPTLPSPAKAVLPPPGIKVLTKMPRTAIEVAKAHLSADQEAAEFLLGGEVLELSAFALKLTKRDGAPLKDGKLPNPSTRKFLMSVGIDLKKADQARLPTLSKDKILDYLAEHYVSVQARVQKDVKGTHYLHHRCIVATGTFRGEKWTEDFHPAVGNAVKDIHALGIFVPPKTDPTPENLRTAVLVHKHTGIDIAAKKTRPEWEFIIVRGRQTALGKLDLHCFVTTHQRTHLHLLQSAQKPPTRYAECSLKAQVYFSKYVDGGLIPSDSVVRNQTVNSQASFVIKELDALVKSELRLTDAFTNLNETLDAIIDGKLKPPATTSANTSTSAKSKAATPVSASKTSTK